MVFGTVNAGRFRGFSEYFKGEEWLRTGQRTAATRKVYNLPHLTARALLRHLRRVIYPSPDAPLPPPHARRITMSFSVASSAARVRAPARVAASAPRAAARATSLAAAPSRGASSSSAAVVALSSKRAVVATGVVSPRASGAVATRATRASAMRVFAGRFETERTYIMIKPDGVQRGYVRRRSSLARRRRRHLETTSSIRRFRFPSATRRSRPPLARSL